MGYYLLYRGDRSRFSVSSQISAERQRYVASAAQRHVTEAKKNLEILTEALRLINEGKAEVVRLPLDYISGSGRSHLERMVKIYQERGANQFVVKLSSKTCVYVAGHTTLMGGVGFVAISNQSHLDIWTADGVVLEQFRFPNTCASREELGNFCQEATYRCQDTIHNMSNRLATLSEEHPNMLNYWDFYILAE
jgi:hypothetical protein